MNDVQSDLSPLTSGITACHCAREAMRALENGSQRLRDSRGL